MIDLMLAHQLVRAMPPRAALILVGDVGFLLIGPGRVLQDSSEMFPVCRLTQVFRQAAESDIITNAHFYDQVVMRSLCPPYPPQRRTRRRWLVLGRAKRER